MERILEFPLPEEWDIFEEKSIKDARCICYQYNVDENGYGPYGFSTDNAKLIIQEIFNDLFFFDKDKKSFKKASFINNNGFYVYGNNVQKLERELLAFLLWEKKKSILEKKSIAAPDPPPYPAILNAYHQDKLSFNGMKNINSSGNGCFVSKFYMPEAGQTLIFTLDDVSDLARFSAKRKKIDYCVFDSIGSLKPW